MWGDSCALADFLHYCVPEVLNVVRRVPRRVPRPERLARDICDAAWALPFSRRSNHVRAMRQLHRGDLSSWQVEHARADAALRRERERERERSPRP